jgi:hypothetical protein
LVEDFFGDGQGVSVKVAGNDCGVVDNGEREAVIEGEVRPPIGVGLVGGEGLFGAGESRPVGYAIKSIGAERGRVDGLKGNGGKRSTAGKSGGADGG